jgi:multidrug efflux pump subunit AcrB
VEQTLAVQQRLLRAADRVAQENGGDDLVQGMQSMVNANTAWIKVFLTPPDVRPLHTNEFVKLWRKETGPIPGLDSMRFSASHGGPGSGANLTVELQHRDTQVLENASGELAAELKEFPIVSDVDDGFSRGKAQFDFTLRPEAHRLGLTTESVARQIRSAYYGREITRQLRGRNEVKIMVRLPQEERHNLFSLENLRLRTPQGKEVPLIEMVDIRQGQSFTEIKRRDGRRAVKVTADVEPPKLAVQVEEQLKAEILPALQNRFSGLTYSFEGRQADRRESLGALGRGMAVAMLIVYTLLAVLFRSYLQPAIVMAAIPFGIVGAVVGHLIMGYSLSLVSFMGVVALSGVVVNDSLVLIDLANRNRQDGHTSYAAVVNAAVARFRPILLTTLTTFFGLLPMIFETSRQARFLIPMALSLGFGIVFATAITLVLIPSLYLILSDAKILLRTLFGGAAAEQQKAVDATDRSL